jgi:hypothetical protein
MRFRVPPEAGPTESVVGCAPRDSGHERARMRVWGCWELDRRVGDLQGVVGGAHGCVGGEEEG